MMNIFQHHQKREICNKITSDSINFRKYIQIKQMTEEIRNELFHLFQEIDFKKLTINITKNHKEIVSDLFGLSGWVSWTKVLFPFWKSNKNEYKFVFGQYFESIEIMLKWISKQRYQMYF